MCQVVWAGRKICTLQFSYKNKAKFLRKDLNSRFSPCIKSWIIAFWWMITSTRNNDLPTVSPSQVFFLLKEHGFWLLYGLARRQMSRLSCPLSPCDCEMAALNLKRAVEIPLGAAGRQPASPAIRDASRQLLSLRETTALILIPTDISYNSWGFNGGGNSYCSFIGYIGYIIYNGYSLHKIDTTVSKFVYWLSTLHPYVRSSLGV